MKTNDETNFEESKLNEATVMDGQEQVNTEVVEEVVEEKSKGNGWKQVVVGGMSGILLGAAGTLFSGFTLPKDETDENHTHTNHGQSQDNHEQLQNVGAEMAMATSVNDTMSFGEAFAAARHEVGAGGAFVWHGQVYGTYYAEEWNSMTPEEQQAFTAQATGSAHADSHAGVEVAVATQDVDPTQTDVHVAAQTNVQETAQTDAPAVQEVEVHVLGVQENVVAGDGSMVNVAVAEVGGQNVMFVDVDQDHTFDVLVADVNGDGQITPNELAPIDDPNLTVENFLAAQGQQATDPSDQLYAQTPDYMNDADVAGFNA
ncbi:MAG: hypothetical protein Q4E55_06345 [Bacteroidales bacterium]|nr:hypothetical protein [Bacteroidales bacterium]